MEEKNYAEILETIIPDDSLGVTVKLNLKKTPEEVPEKMYSVLSYIRDSWGAPIASVLGVHLNGEKKVPHVHYHFVFRKFTPPSNASQHRKRWLAKSENEIFDLDGISMQFRKLETDKPKFSILSYALKEGIDFDEKQFYQCNGKNMSQGMLDFLKSTGQSIYEKELGLALRQEKCEERKKNTLMALEKICKDNRDKFDTFHEMLIWLETNYLEPLELNELPCLRNYQSDCQKIGFKLKLFSYANNIKNSTY